MLKLNLKLFFYKNTIVIKKKNKVKFIFFNENIFIQFIVYKNNVEVALDNITKCLSINFKKITMDDKYIRNITNFLKNTNVFFFCKFKFNGKGFRIQYFNKLKVLNLTFGHSHMYYLYINSLFIKKIAKNKYLIKSGLNSDIIILKKLINSVKPIDNYTLRGLRSSRIKITKRRGRKSTNL